jgi:DNA-binding NarL/FixJ family response regulator
MRESKPTTFVWTNGHESEKDLGLVWIKCPCEEEITRWVVEALSEKAHIHVGREPPQKEDPCCVLLFPNDGVVSDIRRLRFQAPERPLVVFCQGKEPGLVEQALEAGASGFVHAGMRPEKIALALSLACEGEVIIPREMLAELLGHRLFLRRPKLLDP